MTKRRSGNPLWEVVDQGKRLVDLVEPQAAVPSEQVDAYRANVAFRTHAKDVMYRLSALAAAYDRLCDLNLELQAHLEAAHDESLRTGQNTWRVEPEWIEDQEHLWAQVDVESSFIQYELYSVTSMISELVEAKVVSIGSELEYVIKLRDRLLTHPILGGIVRIPGRGGSFGGDGPVHRSVGLSAQFYERFVLAGFADPRAVPSAEEQGLFRLRNEQVIRSKTRNEHLSEEETRSLLAFGARDPSLNSAMAELAQLTHYELLPRVECACQEAIDVFGLERVP